MNKLLKNITFCLIMALIINFAISFNSYVLADGEGFNWKESISDFEKSPGNTQANTATKNIVGAFAVVVKLVGMGVAVVMLIVLAMKYMMAAPGDKADIKKHAVVYVVGAVILFASTQIIGIIAEFSSNIKTT